MRRGDRNEGPGSSVEEPIETVQRKRHVTWCVKDACLISGGGEIEGIPGRGAAGAEGKGRAWHSPFAP